MNDWNVLNKADIKIIKFEEIIITVIIQSLIKFFFKDLLDNYSIKK